MLTRRHSQPDPVEKRESEIKREQRYRGEIEDREKRTPEKQIKN